MDCIYCWRKTGCMFNSNNSHKFMKCLQDEYSVDKCRIDNAATEKENIEGLGQQIRLLKEKEESIDKQIKLLEVESHNIYREWNRLDDELYEKVKLYYGKQEELK